MKIPKLIASDLDGTLVEEGAGALPPALVERLDRLQELGIPFLVSSGRQAASLQTIFAPLKRHPLILALNGGALFQGERLLFQDPIPQRTALEIAGTAAAREGVYVILETARECWVYGTHTPLKELLEQRQYHVRVIDDLGAVTGQVIKVACYTQRDADAMERWALENSPDGIKAARSGATWVDFNVADKGKGLSKTCELLGIAPEDCMAFGDNLNDAPMLDTAGSGFAVPGSILAGTGRFPVCSSVEAVLKKICDEAEKTLAIHGRLW